MPLMISRIGHARGRPVLFAAGRWGSITRHSLSVTSVWYRFVSRICCIRVVGVHMVSPGFVSATPWNYAHPSHSTAFETASNTSASSVFELLDKTRSETDTWTETTFKTSNDQLYNLLSNCLTVLERLVAGGYSVRKEFYARYAKQGYAATAATSLETMIVR